MLTSNTFPLTWMLVLIHLATLSSRFSIVFLSVHSCISLWSWKKYFPFSVMKILLFFSSRTPLPTMDVGAHPSSDSIFQILDCFSCLFTFVLLVYCYCEHGNCILYFSVMKMLLFLPPLPLPPPNPYRKNDYLHCKF